MKSLALLLVGSLAANAVLVGTLVVRSPSRTSDDSTSSDGAQSKTIAAAPDKVPGALAATRPAKPGPPVPRAQIWAALHTGDIEAYIANLRAAGFPEKTVRALVSLALSEHYANRRKELQSAIKPAPYWRERHWWDGQDSKTRAAIREMGLEHRETLKRLLGPEALEESGFSSVWGEQLKNSMPGEKVERISRIQQDYAELSHEVHRAAQGMLLPEDREKLAFLEQEKLADLQTVLTPEEFLEFQLRTSQTANRLRNEFRGVDLTEREFRALYALRTPFDEQFSDAGARKPEQAEARRKAEEELRERYRSVLGEERYAEYQRVRDGNYDQLRRLTQRLALPKETAVRVHELQKSTEQRINEIRRNSQLKPEERNDRLSALAAEVKGSVSSALGARGYEAYLEHGGYWLRNIEPPKPRSASASK